MKKLYILTALLIGAGFTAEAQRVSTGNALPANYEINRDFNRDVTDTLAGPISPDCSNTAPTLYTATGSGYVMGGNAYGDLEKAVYISTESEGLVYSGLAFIGAKNGGNNESFSAKLYTGTLSDGPAELIASSEEVNYADLDTTGNFTTFQFTTPQAFDGSLYLSFEVDSIAQYGIVTTTGANCGIGSLWEKWNTGTWNNLAAAWTNADGPLDIAAYAFLEVETSTVGLDDTNLIVRGSEKIFPNPANESANLVFSLVEPSVITVRIYSTTGVLVDTYNPGFRNTGLSNITINTQSMSQGLYIYSIETEKGVRTGNFAVVR